MAKLASTIHGTKSQTVGVGTRLHGRGSRQVSAVILLLLRTCASHQTDTSGIVDQSYNAKCPAILVQKSEIQAPAGYNIFDRIWENNSFPQFHLLNARSVAGTMALTDNWLQWGLTEYYNYNNLYYTLFGVMVISYMHSKGERGDAAYAAGRCAEPADRASN